MNVKVYYILGEVLYYYRLNTEGACHSDKTYLQGQDCITAQIDAYEMYKNNLRKTHLKKYGVTLDDVFAFKMCIALCYVKGLCIKADNEKYYDTHYKCYQDNLDIIFPNFKNYDVVTNNNHIQTVLFNQMQSNPDYS